MGASKRSAAATHSWLQRGAGRRQAYSTAASAGGTPEPPPPSSAEARQPLPQQPPVPPEQPASERAAAAPPMSPPSAQQQQQQQHPRHHQQRQEYHTISSSWQVPRTQLSHYPPEHQHRMRNGWARGPSSGAAAGAGAAGEAAAAGPPSEVTAAAEQLLAALNWEASGGLANGVGRGGERFSAWAAARLLQLAEQVAAGPAPAAVAEGGAAAAASLAATCGELANELGGYDQLDPAGRAWLVQRARLAAEELLHVALLQYKQRARATRYVGSAAEAAAAGAEGAAAAHPAAPTGRGSAAVAPPVLAAAEAGSAREGRAEPAQPAGLASATLLALASDDDAVSALAHEEETTANGNGGLGIKAQPAGTAAAAAGERTEAQQQGRGEVGTLSPPEQQQPRGDQCRPQRAKRVVGAATLGFRQSFAEAAAAYREASGAPRVRRRRLAGPLPHPALPALRRMLQCGVFRGKPEQRLQCAAHRHTCILYPGCRPPPHAATSPRPPLPLFAYPPQIAALVEGSQRTDEWLRLRERRLTASAFSKALGFFSGKGWGQGGVQGLFVNGRWWSCGGVGGSRVGGYREQGAPGLQMPSTQSGFLHSRAATEKL